MINGIESHRSFSLLLRLLTGLLFLLVIIIILITLEFLVILIVLFLIVFFKLLLLDLITVHILLVHDFQALYSRIVERVRFEESGTVVAFLSHWILTEVHLLKFLEDGELLEGVKRIDPVGDGDDLRERGDGSESRETVIAESAWKGELLVVGEVDGGELPVG